MKRIYLDYAALTPIDPKVIREMKRFSAKRYGNPSALHTEGVLAKNGLIEARNRISKSLNAHSDEIIFTSGGTEANNLALEGVLGAVSKPHIIISAIEHASIMETALALEKKGCEITRVPVDADGIILIDELQKALRPNTILVSIMSVNNETGAIQPIREVMKVVRNFRRKNPANGAYPLVHTDACQGFLYGSDEIEMNMEKLGVDMLTLDGAKVCGPRGIGILYVRRGVKLESVMHGGGQERGLRSGTENLPAIAGFAKALEMGVALREKETARLALLRAQFVEGLTKCAVPITVNASKRAAPHILNVSISNGIISNTAQVASIDSEFFLLQLDAAGIACSTKSSCLRDSDESYVLAAMGVDSKHSLRFSFGRFTTKKEITKTLKIIDETLKNSL
ncbi:MAG: hypothetical protein RIT04_19 [Candidatus Parcubacteria bacterium]|jgi:cysteine desulfurase